MGFKVNQGSQVVNARIVWGTRDKTVPVPNVRYFDGSFLLPADPQHEGEDNPRGQFAIEGHIKEIKIAPSAAYSDFRDKTNEKNGMRMDIVLTSTDGKDYCLMADLHDGGDDYFPRKSLQLLGSLGELSRMIKENEDFRGNVFQFNFYRSADKNGKFHSNSVIRPPVSYIGTDDNPEPHIPQYEAKEIIRSENPPYGTPVKVGNKEVNDNTNVLEWMNQEIEWVNYAFGNPEKLAQQEAQAQAETEDQSETIAATLEQDEVDTEGLAEDLGQAAAPATPRG